MFVCVCVCVYMAFVVIFLTLLLSRFQKPEAGVDGREKYVH